MTGFTGTRREVLIRLVGAAQQCTGGHGHAEQPNTDPSPPVEVAL